jgi:hypothetical protein
VRWPVVLALPRLAPLAEIDSSEAVLIGHALFQFIPDAFKAVSVDEALTNGLSERRYAF